MNYYAVDGRCAINVRDWNLSGQYDPRKVLSALQSKGFKIIAMDLINLARQYVGKSKYCRGAKLNQAPWIVDCSSFIKWLYGQLGIWLPRRTIQQVEYGKEHGKVVYRREAVAGDIVFTSGKINYFIDESSDGIGHNGLVTETKTIIHAANGKRGVVEDSWKEFLNKNEYHKTIRFVPKNQQIFTLLIPEKYEVESSDDIKWIYLQGAS